MKEVKQHKPYQNIFMGHLMELKLLESAWHFLVTIVKYC